MEVLEHRFRFFNMVLGLHAPPCRAAAQALAAVRRERAPARPDAEVVSRGCTSAVAPVLTKDAGAAQAPVWLTFVRDWLTSLD